MPKKFNLHSPKGTHDILPQDQAWWDKVRKEAREITDYYNFSKIETPVLETAELFERSVGAASDIVEKQMFALKDRGGDNLVLRPEGTSAIARAYLQHGLSHLGQPLKLYYDEPMFRYERPQAGRFRQHQQFGLEIIGGEFDPIYEPQIILPIFRLLESLKIKNLILKINTIGCKNCRPEYVQKLRNYYKAHIKDICGDCDRRLKTNALRLLDCKEETCQPVKQGAPTIFDNLCSACSRHFKGVLEFLDEVGLPYQLDNYLVRGLDYYNRTVFEIFTEAQVNVQNAKGEAVAGSFDFALASGGRYDYLFEVLTGKPVSAVGGAIGMDRVIEVMKALNVNVIPRPRPKVFLIHIGERAKKKGLALVEEFRKSGIQIVESLGKDSLNAQFRNANKEGAVFALIFGQKEVFEESIILRDMKTGAQETVPLKKIAAVIKKRL